MTEQERDEMMHRNWVAQMNGMGFDADGYMLDTQHPIRLVEEPQWISVKDKLPENRQWVLCKCRAGIYEVLRREYYTWYHDKDHSYMDDFVTYWMPLPEPPGCGNKLNDRKLMEGHNE